MKTYDYSKLDEHFDVEISLQQAQEAVAEAGTVLAMIPFETDLEQRSAYVHTVAECLYEYAMLLKLIKEKGGAA